MVLKMLSDCTQRPGPSQGFPLAMGRENSIVVALDPNSGNDIHTVLPALSLQMSPFRSIRQPPLPAALPRIRAPHADTVLH
jgi:hypothetical protein